MGFVHLHLHSEYSLLDGAARISDIPAAAKAAGHGAVALTDHGVLYGAVAFYRACKEAGVKPIIGCEVYVAPRSRHSKEGRQDQSGHHLVLLVENEIGYQNLITLVSKSFTEGFYSKPRVDEELLSRHSDGLIALSACMAGKIPQLVLSGDLEGAREAALSYRSIFGRDNFFLEIQDHGLEDDRRILRALSSISRETGIPLVATNDVHYLRRVDADAQAILLCIQTQSVITDGRPIGFETDEFYYKSTEEMQRLFSAYPEAISNTERIAERCNFDFRFGELHLPTLRTEGGRSHAEELSHLAYEGLKERTARGEVCFTEAHPESEYLDRLAYELSVIDKMGFNGYYLIVRDFVRYAKENGIPVGPGRGSGAGSLVAYAVGITDVDSVAFELLFERFLNPERISMPDFDIDFCYERRDRVIGYVRERYGEEHVAQIATFGTMAARAAVRDVGRALGMPYSEVDRLAVRIPHHGVSLSDAEKLPEIAEILSASESYRRLFATAKLLEGMPRHASTHAAGIVITEREVSHYVPLSVNGSTVVTQYDMDTIAALGLVKFDFLGLRYLTIIDDAEREIRRSRPDFSVSALPLDDAGTYRMLTSAQTLGVFQMESGGMRQVLRRLCPSCISDIIACIALYRPGPMDSINTFIARKHGEEPIVYAVPELASVLDLTYGCIVYQEQVMEIFRTLAGYSYARADLVRRAMSKKKADVMAAEESSFLSGSAERGVSREDAEKLFHDIASFANYAFNKSHATAYGLLTFRTAYLKCHFPREYMAALLTSVLDNAPKLAEYIGECARLGIAVLKPDILRSRVEFSVSDSGIRFGLLAVRGVGRQFLLSVIREREKKPFSDFSDFISRMSGYDVNRRQVDALIKCGALDCLGDTRRTMSVAAETLLSDAQAKARTNLVGQLDFFSDGSAAAPPSSYERFAEFDKKDLLAFEREYLGICFSGHPLDEFSDDARVTPHTPISEILGAVDESGEIVDPAFRDKMKLTVVGVVSERTEKTTRSGEKMAFVTLEDRVGQLELIVFPNRYSKFAPHLVPAAALAVEGELSVREGEGPKLLVTSLRRLTQNREREGGEQRAVTLYLRVDSLSSDAALSARAVLDRSPGTTPIVFFEKTSRRYSAYVGHGVRITELLLERLRNLLGSDSVVLR